MGSGAVATNGPPYPHILLTHSIMGGKFYCKGCLVLNACGQKAVVINWGVPVQYFATALF